MDKNYPCYICGIKIKTKGKKAHAGCIAYLLGDISKVEWGKALERYKKRAKDLEGDEK